MSLRVCSAVFGVVGVVLAGGQVARADDGSGTDTAPTAASGEDVPVQPDPADEVHYGVGLRFSNVRGPKFLLNVGVEHLPGGTSDFGYGIEVTRRKKITCCPRTTTAGTGSAGSTSTSRT
jgi:hypothetical protein